MSRERPDMHQRCPQRPSAAGEMNKHRYGVGLGDNPAAEQPQAGKAGGVGRRYRAESGDEYRGSRLSPHREAARGCSAVVAAQHPRRARARLHRPSKCRQDRRSGAAEVFEVKLGVAGLNNAFIRHRRARSVAEVGRACRHNVIALACSGAALALREVVESLIRRSSRSQDLPKRSGGTKVQLLRRGHSATW